MFMQHVYAIYATIIYCDDLLFCNLLKLLEFDIIIVPLCKII